MTNTDKNKKLVYQKIGIIILIITCAILAYFAFLSKRPILQNTETENILKKQIQDLNNENGYLKESVHIEKIKSSQYQHALDSLEGLKPKIVTKYVTIYKNIDSLNADSVVDDFNRVFADKGIK